MLDELIKIFVDLKTTKEEKFQTGNSEDYYKWNKVKELLEQYKEDVFVLFDLEPFFRKKENINNEPNYMNYIVSMLRIMKNNITEEDIAKIRTDEHVIEEISDLEAKVERAMRFYDKSSVIEREKASLTDIINELTLIKENGETDYIDQDLIMMIYDYLLNETHISYRNRFVATGGLIVGYNNQVARRRTSR